MIMDNNIKKTQLKNLLAETKIEASENLKFRIVQQINTEVALSRKTEQVVNSSFRSILLIVCVVTIIITFALYSIYFNGVEGSLVNKESFYLYILPFCSIASFVACLFAIDTKLRSKKLKRGFKS